MYEKVKSVPICSDNCYGGTPFFVTKKKNRAISRPVLY